MKIVGAESHFVVTPPSSQLPYSSWSAEVGRQVWVRLETDAGVTGWGACFSYRGPEDVVRSVDRLASSLTGMSAEEPAALLEHMERTATRGSAADRYAIAGIELAAWDALAKARGVTAGELVFAPVEAKPRSELPAYASLPRYAETALVAEAVTIAVARGYRAIKLHQFDVESVRIAREAAGSQVALMLDVNGAWSVDEAIAICRKLEPYQLEWVEEPIHPLDDHAGLAKVRRAVGIKIAAGENESEWSGYEHMLAAGAVDIVQPSLLKVGGAIRFQEIARRVHESGVVLAPHAYYFGPGFSACAHYAATDREVSWFEVPFVDLPHGVAKRDSRSFLNGSVTVPTGIGWGADPDLASLSGWRVVNGVGISPRSG